MNTLVNLQQLGERFAGVDLQMRKPHAGWPLPWRVTLRASKNERAEYRIGAFSETAEGAVRELLEQVARIDGSKS